MMNACLQINMAPLDIRHIVHTLPHQLRMLGAQVEEIQFTVDNHHSQVGRYATGDYAEKHAELRRYLKTVCNEFPHANIVDVDYSPATMAEVGRAFTGGDSVPMKAYDGSPFHAYLYGLLRARCPYVFHIDSDMLFGGSSQSWIAEAIELMEKNKDVRVCTPLEGPPRAGGLLKGKGIPTDLQHVSFSYNGIGTRVFFLDRRRFLSGEDRIPLVRATRGGRIYAFLFNTSPYLPLENCVSALMQTKGLRRVSFLGSGGGLWHLHPPYRSERFYAELPSLIKRIESNDIPDGQRGDYDVNDSMIDWSDARLLARSWRRFPDQLRFAAISISERVRG